MTSKKAIIYMEIGANPAVDRIVTEHGDNRTMLVAVPKPSAAANFAVELVDGGIDFIELCGSFEQPQ